MNSQFNDENEPQLFNDQRISCERNQDKKRKNDEVETKVIPPAKAMKGNESLSFGKAKTNFSPVLPISELLFSPTSSLVYPVQQIITQSEKKIPRSEFVLGFEDLPTDAIKLIALKCAGQSLRALSCTCKRLNSIIVSDEHLWQLICERDLPYRQLEFSSLSELRDSIPNPDGSKITWKSLLTIYNQILKQDCISCTGLDHNRKSLQRNFSLAMGANWQGHLDRGVTILVVGISGTEKYKFAKQEGIATVTEEWIKDCFKSRVRKNPKDYEPPIFSGIKFCATQLRPAVRAYIEEECVRKGAEYTADLRKDHNTHLIAVRPGGPKFEFAHRWNVKIVKPSWFFDCLKKQTFVDEQDYIIPYYPTPEHHFNDVHILNGLQGGGGTNES
eukprot:c19787_g1_i1.p1 GENE.c19787_g1_i1~~c19787_g1_i1.p1  ORF type:complete len:387 (-),score=116.14 c19787_g1_i1:80-1240(-)